MTRPIHDEHLKQEHDAMSDHLRNHVHLTNCIHLKNHIHRLSPNISEKSLLRDLVKLQRSKSLRDPSTSPTPWYSSPISPGVNRWKERRRLSVGSSKVVDLETAKGKTDLKKAKTLGEQLAESGNFTDSEDLEPSRFYKRGLGKSTEQNFKGMKRVEESKEDSLTESSGEVNGSLDLSRAPKNVCGMHLNWLKIQDRSKIIIDKAGKHLSCGLTESTLRRNRDIIEASSRSDSESLPLLIEPSRSLASTENSFISNEHSSRNHGQHQSLTQKYAPKNFRDLVGQNLVVQALSNAVVRGKIGSIYVFYGPHGTGKTSCAHIFARAINCKSREHLKPCGECNSCISHDLGKNRNIMQLGSFSKSELESISFHFEKSNSARSSSSRYQVFILDDCDTVSTDLWNWILKVIDLAPRRVVFLLISSSLDFLPHMIISRCQKFFFSKLKDAEIIHILQRIACREGLEIENNALKIIASRSDGSLRDAEMTLDQLSLLGQPISVPLVQELVGLISDEKLVDLLDLALSSDMANTVKRLKDIMEAGVEPLALMSQLATVMTDILGGSYIFTIERLRWRFFGNQTLSKEDMEKLRYALKILSEAEKQLRSSNDKWTWLTAALLQLAPHQNYASPISFVDRSQPPSNITRKDILHTSPSGIEKGSKVNAGDVYFDNLKKSESGKKQTGLCSSSKDYNKRQRDLQKIWCAVLEKIQLNSLRKFVMDEGKLTSLSFGFAPTVQLTFSLSSYKSKVENHREHILQAFEFVLSSPVILEIRYESGKDAKPNHEDLQMSENHSSRAKPATSNDGKLRLGSDSQLSRTSRDHPIGGPSSVGRSKSEITEAGEVRAGNSIKAKDQSLVKSKVSLAQVIQRGEGWSTRKAISIAEKLEQENLRLEPRSRSLLCCNASKITRGKVPRRFRFRLRNISWERCLRSKSPR